jgi:hypothetical protein
MHDVHGTKHVRQAPRSHLLSPVLLCHAHLPYLWEQGYRSDTTQAALKEGGSCLPSAVEVEEDDEATKVEDDQEARERDRRGDDAMTPARREVSSALPSPPSLACALPSA